MRTLSDIKDKRTHTHTLCLAWHPVLPQDSANKKAMALPTASYVSQNEPFSSTTRSELLAFLQGPGILSCFHFLAFHLSPLLLTHLFCSVQVQSLSIQYLLHYLLTQSPSPSSMCLWGPFPVWPGRNADHAASGPPHFQWLSLSSGPQSPPEDPHHLVLAWSLLASSPLQRASIKLQVWL